MFPQIERVLIDRARIAERVRELGRTIARDLAADAGGPEGDGDGRIILVPVLTGSIVFVADLIRELPLKLSLGVVTISSYPGKSIESKGAAIRGELPRDLAGKHVLIVDDVLDSGETIGLVQSLIREQRPASLRTCVFLRKAVRRAREVSVDYVGFDIENAFVVGFGLDFDGHYRNLPDIATLKPVELRGAT